MEGRLSKLWGKLVMPVALAVLMGISSCVNAYAYDVNVIKVYFDNYDSSTGGY